LTQHIELDTFNSREFIIFQGGQIYENLETSAKAAKKTPLETRTEAAKKTEVTFFGFSRP